VGKPKKTIFLHWLKLQGSIYVCVSATSTPSERLFSDAGNTLTAKRANLNPILFERIVFLKKNLVDVEKFFD